MLPISLLLTALGIAFYIMMKRAGEEAVALFTRIMDTVSKKNPLAELRYPAF